MKFGKSIRAEARDNRGLSFINFKNLKRLLKKSCSTESEGCEEDQQFLETLKLEIRKVGDSFWKELQNISVLQDGLQQRLPHLDLHPDPATFTDMTFDQLLCHLQTLGGLEAIPSPECPAPPTSAKTSAALIEFCVTLGKISARCKRLRRCVLWNAVGIVKILKKRQKLEEARTIPSGHLVITAAQVLSQQEWYRCPALSRIVSVVEITTDELMQRLTQRPPNRDSYQCPICLDVVLDPVCLRTCGHRFCWACLCMAYCERPEGTLERCPCCRAAFPLDPEAFEIDGILSRFLKTFFPDLQSKRLKEQQENIRQRLDALNHYQTFSIPDNSQLLSDVSQEPPHHHHNSVDGSFQLRTHCCPDCDVPDRKQLDKHGVIDQGLESFMESTGKWYVDASSSKSSVVFDSISDSKTFACSVEKSSDREMDKRPCQHVQNVREGKPSDMDGLAFSSVSSAPWQNNLSAATTTGAGLFKKMGVSSVLPSSELSCNNWLSGSSYPSIDSTGGNCSTMKPELCKLPIEQHQQQAKNFGLPAPVHAVVESLLVDAPTLMTSLPFDMNKINSEKTETASVQGHRLVCMLEQHLSRTEYVEEKDKDHLRFWGLMCINPPANYRDVTTASLGQMMMDTDSPQCDLPELMNQAFLPTSEMQRIRLYYDNRRKDDMYEAVDDEDDAIEEEFLKLHCPPQLG